MKNRYQSAKQNILVKCLTKAREKSRPGTKQDGVYRDILARYSNSNGMNLEAVDDSLMLSNDLN